jgi:hypothetical protein
MQVFDPGKTPVNDFTSERSAFQNLQQNQSDEFIGFFGVIGIFQGNVADRHYEISQGGIDSVFAVIYFHAACFRFREQKRYEVSFETRALTQITKLLFDGRRLSTVVPAD